MDANGRPAGEVVATVREAANRAAVFQPVLVAGGEVVQAFPFRRGDWLGIVPSLAEAQRAGEKVAGLFGTVFTLEAAITVSEIGALLVEERIIEQRYE